MPVQVTGNVAAIDRGVARIGEDNSFGDKLANRFHKESEPQEQRFRNAKLTPTDQSPS